MRVKRYVVDTMPDAMQSIRSELGSDAVILSTKEIKIGGFLGMFKKKKIEVVAAVENEQKRVVNKKPSAPLNVPRSAVPQAYLKASGSQPAGDLKPQEENRTYAELAAALTDAVGIPSSVAVFSNASQQDEDDNEKELSAFNLGKTSQSKDSALYESLGIEQTSAVSSVLDSEVLNEIREMKQWMERFARQTSGSRDIPEPLIDLRERLIEQEMDMDLIEIWVSSVFDQWINEGSKWSLEQFQDSLKEQVIKFLSNRIGQGIARDTRILYIAGPTGVGKTTTIAKLAAEQLFRQQSLLSKDLKSETYLVLSLTSKSRDMKIITEHFNKYQLDKVIFTKLDETESYGPLFNLLKEFPLGLSYLSNGQNVPDDLLMASEEKLYGMLLGTGGK